jgi:DNA polymerase delta subunit 1
MVDTGLVGCQWVELPAASYRVRDAAAHTSLCQLEVDVGFDAFIAHPPEGEWAKVLGFSIFVFGQFSVFV